MSVEKRVLTSQDWTATDLSVQLAEVYHWCPLQTLSITAIGICAAWYGSQQSLLATQSLGYG